MKALAIRQRRELATWRRLNFEALEDRRILDAAPLSGMAADEPDAAPWQNPLHRLDVNNDGATTPRDGLIVVGRILSVGSGPLPDPGGEEPEFYYDTNGDNRLSPIDLVYIINGILTPPKVEINTYVPVTADLTPNIIVTASDVSSVPDGSPLDLDVDLNGDGSFNGPGELGYMHTAIYGGFAAFEITPALPDSPDLYDIHLRARVRDDDAVSGSSEVVPLQVDRRPSTVLEDYVAADDGAYDWEVIDSSAGTGYTRYVLDLTSQIWRSANEVDITEWHHDLEIYVPTVQSFATAVMIIDIPDMPVDLGQLAAGTQSVVVHLPSVPNQPLQFSDETQDRSEDRLLAYSFDKFIDHYGEPGNETWPALLPMVKSAVKAMDAVQEFVPTLGNPVNDFVVTGYSKRGWTTWLTAAVDDRVRAIMPGVFDNLNQGPQIVSHYGGTGFFADALRAYTDQGLFQDWNTPEAYELERIIDPYSYLDNGRFDDMPKLILNATGDEFFAPDSSQFYIHDLPGNKNYLRYMPNTNHGLGVDEDPTDLINATVGFYAAVLNNIPLPQYSWTVGADGAINVQTSSSPSAVKLWQATTSDHDFRIRKNPAATWTSTPLADQGGGTYVGNVPRPQDAATAYLVELTFPNPVPSLPDFVFTTEVRVKSSLPFYPFLGAPDIKIDTLTKATSDTSPWITVNATGGDGTIEDGTTVWLDVDLNDDDDFDDPGELGYMQSTMYEGSSSFEITPALPRASQTYYVHLRARLANSLGYASRSRTVSLQIDTRTSSALEDYVNTPDASYQYSVVSNQDFGAFTYYVLSMTSQTWRSVADVDDPVWDHWIGVYVPNSASIDNTALMLIDGGSNKSGPPSADVGFLGALSALSNTVVFDLTTVPNEPVTFTDESFSRSEDEIIAYTFDKFLEHLGEPGNETWPLLLPMAKSAVRAMDTIQDFIPTVRPASHVDEFVVSGGSKRGWTTWLTAAVDDRVAAIMPAVIDVLNMGQQMVHHYGAYGFFSAAIQDYENLQIFERLLTPAGRELGLIVDPYSYLHNGRFDDLPKLLLNSAGDEFFVSDSAQFYYQDIPGEDTRLRYFPNTGHGLEEEAVFNSVASFYGAILLDLPLPQYSWTVAQDGAIHVQTTQFQPPSQVLLWQATNPVSRDFRHFLTGDIWTSTPLTDQGGGTWVGDVSLPATGATAYFVELTFDFPYPGVPSYVFTTEIRVKTNLPLYDWPFYGDTQEAPRGVAARAEGSDVGDLGSVASALAIQSLFAETPSRASAVDALPAASVEPAPRVVETAADQLLLPANSSDTESDESDDAELAESIFGSSLDELLV